MLRCLPAATSVSERGNPTSGTTSASTPYLAPWSTAAPGSIRYCDYRSRNVSPSQTDDSTSPERGAAAGRSALSTGRAGGAVHPLLHRPVLSADRPGHGPTAEAIRRARGLSGRADLLRPAGVQLGLLGRGPAGDPPFLRRLRAAPLDRLPLGLLHGHVPRVLRPRRPRPADRRHRPAGVRADRVPPRHARRDRHRAPPSRTK